MKKFLKTTKGKITMAAVGVAAVAAVVVAVLVVINNNKYRSISVADVKGIVNIIGQKNNGQAYKGQRLFDGDDVSVMQDSELTLCLNNDKYVYADENTHFTLEAASSRQGNKLKIVLDKGSELNVLTAKLGDGDTYQVDTPNSTMSVRGTRFRMTVYKGDDGYTYTLLEVESGVVLAQLKTLTGDYNGVEKEFHAGESALIRGGDDFSEFVISDSEDVVWNLDHNTLPSEAVPRLIELLMKSKELEAASKEAEEKALAEAEEKEKAQVAEKDTDKDKDADKDADSDKDADKDSKDNDAKDSKDGKDAKDTKDNKDNKDTAKENNDANNQASGGGEQNNNGGEQNNGGGEQNNGGGQPASNPQPASNSEPTHTHTLGDWEISRQPGCETEGKKVKICSGCGYEIEIESIDPLGHNWGSWEYPTPKDEPDCTNGGTHKRVCSVCGKEESEAVGPLGHDFSKWVTDATVTCTTDGTEKCVCSRCGAENGDKRTSQTAPGHDMQPTGNKTYIQVPDPTGSGMFIDDGYNVEYECSICHYKETKFESNKP